jgi:hypothetical protein
VKSATAWDSFITEIILMRPSRRSGGQALPQGHHQPAREIIGDGRAAALCKPVIANGAHLHHVAPRHPVRRVIGGRVNEVILIADENISIAGSTAQKPLHQASQGR